MERIPCVYLLASKLNGTLYIGVKSQLPHRVSQHKHNLVGGFTKKYHVHMLVWYEAHETMESAISREKELRKWRRKWKIELIEQTNREWLDLYIVRLFEAGCRVSAVHGISTSVCVARYDEQGIKQHYNVVKISSNNN